MEAFKNIVAAITGIIIIFLGISVIVSGRFILGFSLCLIGGMFLPIAKTLTSRMNDKYPKTAKLSLWVFICIVMFMFVSGLDETRYANREPAPKKIDIDKEMSNASTRCQMLVQAYLKSPSSAKFPADYTKGITVSEDKIFTIHSHVDSQNGFGATLRTPYICKLQYIGGGQHGWELLDFQIQ